MGGVAYGEPPAAPAAGEVCPDEASWMANPARFDMGHSRMGPHDDPHSAWGYYATVHPTVRQVRVVVDDDRPFVVDTKPLPERPEGPRFVGFAVPPGTRHVTVELLAADGSTVIKFSAGP